MTSLWSGLAWGKMTVGGAERLSKFRRDSTLDSMATLQGNYDRLWLHVRIIYVLLAVLTAFYLAAAFAVLGAHRLCLLYTCHPTATTPDSRMSWRNVSSSDDRMAEIAEKTGGDVLMMAGRRRRSSARRFQRPAAADDSDVRSDGPVRRLRAADATDAGLPPSSWVGGHQDSSRHDGLWMTMHSKIPVDLHPARSLIDSRESHHAARKKD